MNEEELLGQLQPTSSPNGLLDPFPEQLALLPLFNTVMYPLTVTPLALSMQASLQLLDQAPALPLIGLVTLRDERIRPAQIAFDACYSIGTAAIAHRLLRLPDGTMRMAFEGLERIQITAIEQETPFLIARVRAFPDADSSTRLPALAKEARILALELLNYMSTSSEELRQQIHAEKDIRRLSYLLAASLMFQSSTAERQSLLALPNSYERLERIKHILARELARQRQLQPVRSSLSPAQAPDQHTPKSTPPKRPSPLPASETQPAPAAWPAPELQAARRVALVTGATRGIGAATARRLAHAGMQIAICGRTVSAGEALVAELGGAEHALFIEADLSRAEDCARVVDATLERFGRLDVLVNNAASVARGNLEDTSAEAFDAMMALNLRAPFLLAQRALPCFKAQFEREGIGGAIINIGSVNGYIGAQQLLAYSTSKGGLITMTRNLANALSPWRIRVHVLNVGWTLSEGEDILQRSLGAAEDWAERAGASRPWGRLLKPEEIAAAVAFLASAEAAIFSGASLDLEQLPVGSPIGQPGK